MSDIVAFLNARLDEDEDVARSVEHAVGADYDPFMAKISETLGQLGVVSLYYRRHDPARVLREVKAKRELMDLAFEHAAKIDGEWGCCHSPESVRAGRCEDERPEHQRILRTLAVLYDEHPDYDPAWAGDIET